jgi:hypothetical protein
MSDKWIVITNNNESATPILLFTSKQTAEQYCANNPGSKYKIYCAIDAELAKQREADPVGCIHPDTLAAMQTDSRMERAALRRWTEVTKLDGHIPVYTHPQQRNAVEVTDEMVESALKVFFSHKDGYDRMGMRAALSTVASRDREDAVKTEVSESLLDAWRSIAHVSGSALLSGDKKANNDEQRGLVYREACNALIWVGNAYHELTGKHPDHDDAARRESKP